jgi:hypothetical protein
MLTPTCKSKFQRYRAFDIKIYSLGSAIQTFWQGRF